MLDNPFIASIYLIGKTIKFIIVALVMLLWPLALFAIGMAYHLHWLAIVGIALWVIWVIIARPLQSIKKAFDKAFE